MANSPTPALTFFNTTSTLLSKDAKAFLSLATLFVKRFRLPAEEDMNGPEPFFKSVKRVHPFRYLVQFFTYSANHQDDIL